MVAPAPSPPPAQDLREMSSDERLLLRCTQFSSILRLIIGRVTRHQQTVQARHVPQIRLRQVQKSDVG